MKAIKVLFIYLFIYLPFLQLSKESYLAGRKICFSWITEHDLFWGLSLLTALIWTFQWSGVSIKIEVASGLDRVTNCINKGLLVPSSRWRGGGRSKCILPLNILKFQSPKNAIFGVLGTKFEEKRACFSLKKM